MRPGYNGKRQRFVDQRLWHAATLIRRAFHQSLGLGPYCAYLADKAATIISAMARTAEYPLTQPVASLSANPARQVLEAV